MSAPGVNDHQTFFSGPPPEGNPLVTTQDTFPNVIYYCVNTLSRASCSLSTDGGVTFQPVNKPFTPASAACTATARSTRRGACSSRTAGATSGGPAMVAVSEDGGFTWETHEVAAEPESSINHTAVDT